MGLKMAPATAVIAAYVLSKLQQPRASVPTSGEMRSFIGLAVDRVVKEQPTNQSWSSQEKKSVAERYYRIFTAGATGDLTDGDMLNVWAEHVQYTKQYRQHTQYLGFSWRDMLPAKYDDVDSFPTQYIQVTGQTFPLSGMDEVAAKQGWTPQQLDRAVAGYGQFIRALVANSLLPAVQRRSLAPSVVVDEIWHQHIRHGRQYSRMCTGSLGRYLNHSPHLTDADKTTGPSSYAHTLGLIRAAGEAIDGWAWPAVGSEYCLSDCISRDCSGSGRDCSGGGSGGDCGSDD